MILGATPAAACVPSNPEHASPKVERAALCHDRKPLFTFVFVTANDDEAPAGACYECGVYRIAFRAS